MKKRFLALALCLSCILGLTPKAFADGPLVVSPNPAAVAQDISDTTKYTASGFDSTGFLKDKNLKNYYTSSGDTTITLENAKGIGSIYLLFHFEYGSYSVTNNDTQQTLFAGENNFLHDYVDLEEAWGTTATSVTLRFRNGSVTLSELYVFASGDAPSHVQQWEKPLTGRADILLLSSHGDDEQLFYAGLLPLYAAEKGLNVQVVYMTDHRNMTKTRVHEMLNGLWAVGVTAYPVFGSFKDFLLEDLTATYNRYAQQGVSKEQLLGFVVENIRRFRPQVIVGHDINGEYKHGMHMVYTDCLIKALDIVGDPAQYTESAAKYDVWTVPKTYLHLYEKNPIVMNYDIPLESFDGMTAFEVTQKLGYPCHETQQFTWFTDWINGKREPITKASQIKTYSPCLFGLYRSTVGEDVLKNDFMENIVPYRELERIEEEKRQEEERIKAEEEKKRQEEEAKKRQEELERQEQLRQEEEARQNAEKKQQNTQKQKTELYILVAVMAVLVLLLILVIVLYIKDSKKKKRRKK